jgi:ketosteroid isomerase-like protein
MTPATVPQGFRETNRIFEEEVVGKGDFGALARVYTANATILPPGAEMITGLDNIEAFWMQAAVSLGVTAVRLHSLSVQVLGDTAYEIGRAKIDRATAEPMAVKYVVIWKQEAGSWKWHVDIWNPVS